MRDPNEVLNHLSSKACDESYRFKRLYRNFYNPRFYLLAYARISGRQGNLTPGTDDKTIDGMNEKRIMDLIESMKNYSYHPAPARRTYIPKKNGETRPIGIPAFEDKLVQEVMRMILEAIWEPTFLDTSHGFRPDRSCHTALSQMQKGFKSTKWFIEGDIKGCFDNIDHHVLANLVSKRIDDGRFIDLLWKFLKAGYMEQWEYHNTYSGTPQGSVISPVLSNIYLHELDKFMQDFKKEYDCGTVRRDNPEYQAYNRKIRKLSKALDDDRDQINASEIKARIKEIKQLRQLRSKLPVKDAADPNYKRVQYVRYADDFLIGVIGSRKDAEYVKRTVEEFLKQTLKLDMSEEKTLITHGRDFAHFLGYAVTTTYSQNTEKNALGVRKRPRSGTIALYIPHEVWVKKLQGYGALKIKMVEGKEVYEPTKRSYLLHLDDLEILSRYNAEIRELYNYYRLANNASVLSKFRYVMKYSMYKTFAAKYRTTIKKIVKKYRDGKDFAVQYETAKGQHKKAVFYNQGFAHDPFAVSKKDPYQEDKVLWTLARTSLLDRLQAGKCEWCGAESEEIEIHHVRKLKDLKGKKAWERKMIERNRKTMALCPKCHRDLHAGRLD
ncbi:MAG: group II intron reverse transcriptase/maturase [Clostridia bacterium]|nr:group II intron reverse transcriptase/maturase [Clostridia bacterium]